MTGILSLTLENMMVIADQMDWPEMIRVWVEQTSARIDANPVPLGLEPALPSEPGHSHYTEKTYLEEKREGRA